MEFTMQESLFSTSNIEFAGNLTDQELSEYLKNIKGKVVAFTGHRPNHLPWGFNEDCDLCKVLKKKLDKLLKLCIKQGFKVFISGVALGFDTYACDSVLKLKKKNPDIELILAIPCKNQAEHWSEQDKVRYENILLKANPVYVSTQYYKGCFIKRNQFMVDRADLVIACCNGQSGGTMSTIDYAIKKHKNILILEP